MFKQVSAILKGFARRFNSTVHAGDINLAVDPNARLVQYPYQFRGGLATAYVSLTNGTKTEFLAAGGAGVFHDLVQLYCLNTSAGAVTITLLDESTTVSTIKLSATQGQEVFTFPAPIPQNGANTAWYIDLPDDNNSTVYVEAIFVKNT